MKIFTNKNIKSCTWDEFMTKWVKNGDHLEKSIALGGVFFVLDKTENLLYIAQDDSVKSQDD